MNSLQNMSVPPKSTVETIVEPVDEVIAFNPKTLRIKLKMGVHDSIVDKVKEYINDNPTWEINIKSPKSYMVSIKYKFLRDIDENVIECEDIDLLIYMFSKTCGKLYIPDKEPAFDKERFENTLYFLKKEVENEL